MPLTATQRTFLVVKLKILTGWAASCFKDPLNGYVDDYLREEAEVISEIENLMAAGCALNVIRALERDVEDVQARVRGATRKTGPDALEAACQRLVVIQNMVLRSHREVGKFQDMLQETQLRIGMLSEQLAGRLTTQYMGMIEAMAREGSYDDAQRMLRGANQAIDDTLESQAAVDAARRSTMTVFESAEAFMTALERDTCNAMIQKAEAAAAESVDETRASSCSPGRESTARFQAQPGSGSAQLRTAVAWKRR